MAISNAGPGRSSTVADLQYPEMPPPLDESEIADVSLDMSQAAIEAELTQQQLDISGIERIPDADPGLDVSKASTQ